MYEDSVDAETQGPTSWVSNKPTYFKHFNVFCISNNFTMCILYFISNISVTFIVFSPNHIPQNIIANCFAIIIYIKIVQKYLIDVTEMNMQN